LQCTRVRFEPGAARGQFTVTPVAGTTFEVDADALIPAIGQDPDIAVLRDRLETKGSLLHTDERQAASLAGVYAGGDVASMARFVTEAIGMGKRAAREIHRTLLGDAAAEREHRGNAHVCGTADIVRLDAINTFYHVATARAMDARLDPAQRLATGAEVQIALDAAQALAEAERCFSCGTCITCDNCVQYCPDLAVQRDGAGYVVLTDYCKGCGLCVKECPTGSMRMIEEAR
jgi:Pyruvate/2-oxoacid:ferredoxin oxidoreductase delta subunit